MERFILHSDLNNFFASVECLYHEELALVPFAVAGAVEERHGIILAKNDIAKSFGVSTGEPIWSAKQKCPSLVTCTPHYDKYVDISNRVKEIYLEYSDAVEPFGIDECWIDISRLVINFRQAEEIADEIRAKIKKRVGITASVGVSFNKVFAKLGSDMKKPDATTVITRENYQSTAWKLPAESLLYVGKATLKILKNINLKTIGDIARAEPSVLELALGKNGLTLWDFANGNCGTSVIPESKAPAAKSMGNSITPYRDLESEDDISTVLYYLCDTVSSRMRAAKVSCGTVQISVRNSDMYTYERQEAISNPSRTARCLYETAFSLLKANRKTSIPIRSLGVRACNLIPDESIQLSIFSLYDESEKYEKIEFVSDMIRHKFGGQSLTRGILLTDTRLCRGNIHSD